MSYILDALKKNQANHAGNVNLDVPVHQASRNPLWLILIVVALFTNAGIVTWLLWPDPEPANHEQPSLSGVPKTAPVQPIPRPTIQPRPKPSAPPKAKPKEEPKAEPKVEPPPRGRVIYEEPSTPTDTEVSAPKPAPANTPPTDAPDIDAVHLRDLPVAEQTLYNGFSYTSHIYTDDPDLCAVVIDGQRLQTGDAFKGLQIVAITESGVIFQENRRGVVRNVEVTPFE